MKSFQCQVCDKQVDTQEQLIEHSKRNHRDEPQAVWTAIGKTWSTSLDHLFQSKDNYRRDADDAKKLLAERDKELTDVKREYSRLKNHYDAIIVIAQGEIATRPH